ncbi:MAG TPA: HEPN domain-containing protein [Ktedonobacterales bacterium]
MSLDEALGIWGEAAQDLMSARLAYVAGNFYNCADLCNQVAEKALQSVYVLTHDARAAYNHNLRALGELVQAPPDILSDLATLSGYHPSVFLPNRTLEEADDEVAPETADQLMGMARGVLRWARPLVLGANPAPGRFSPMGGEA